MRNTLLYSSLDELLSEKRLQFRSKIGVCIEGDFKNGVGLFSSIDNVALKQVISNLINNAVEALENDKGNIKVSLRKHKNKCLIEIEDNGKGIPSHIIKKLGSEGVSFGKTKDKESGSGIGLFHAKKSLEQWKGSLHLESIEGKGTIISLFLPMAPAPHWFKEKIFVSKGQTVVILDDDHEIHHTWAEKFKTYNESKNISLVHFSTPQEVKEWIVAHEQEDFLFLSDYELIGLDETGLDIIKDLQIQSQSTLVTSHYEEEQIQVACKEIGLKILPKMMAANTPIICS